MSSNLFVSGDVKAEVTGPPLVVGVLPGLASGVVPRVLARDDVTTPSGLLVQLRDLARQIVVRKPARRGTTATAKIPLATPAKKTLDLRNRLVVHRVVVY